MVRIRIRITEEQAACLRKLSEARGASMAELVRQGIEYVIGQAGVVPVKELRARAAAAAGRFRSGRKDVARRHDTYLAGTYSVNPRPCRRRP